MYIRHLLMVSTLFLGKVTGMSVIPCRLNVGLHEWRNEIPTVPN